MSFFSFLNNTFDKKEEDVKYELLVEFYKKYIQVCTLQPCIFPQIAYKYEEMDVIDSKYVKVKPPYISQYSRLIDAIRLGDVLDENGKWIDLNLAQEFHLRFGLASWIMSQLNSYNSLHQKIKNAILNGYKQLVFIVELQKVKDGEWFTNAAVTLYESDTNTVTYRFSTNLFIKEEIFYSSNSIGAFSECITFFNTPIPLLNEVYQVTYMLMCTTPPLIYFKSKPRRTHGYADFWLKKTLATIITVSDEWEILIHSCKNIKKINNIKYYLHDEDFYEKRIQFKFDIELKVQREILHLDYEYYIPSAERFRTRFIRELSDFVLTYHNLQD